MPRRLALIIFALSSALCATGLAQVQSVWIQQTLHSPRPFLFPIEVLPRPDGGVVTVGLGYSNGNRMGNADVVVSAFDDLGEKLWTWDAPCEFDSATGILSRCVTAAGMDAAGNVYLSYTLSNRSVVVGLDSAGAVRWQRSVVIAGGTAGCAVTSLDVSAAGDVRVAAFGLESTTWPRIKVVAFDSAGIRAWTWSGGLSQGTTGIPCGVHVAPDGSTYVHGTNDSFVFSQFQKNFAMRLDANGQLDWYDDLATNAGSLSYQRGEIAPNGDLVALLTGSVSNFPGSDPVRVLRRYRPDGTISVNVNLDGLLIDPWAGLRDLKVAPNGDTLVAFSGVNEVLLVDAAGVPVTGWAPPTGTGEVLAIWPTADRGVIVTTARATGGTVDTRFSFQGQVVWSEARGGVLPIGLDDLYPSWTDIDVAVGTRGNLFVSNATQNPAVVGQRSGVAKLIEGPPVGNAYCGPAVANSTGAPAALTGLGSDVRGSDNLSLLATNLPVGAFVLFVVSDQAGFVPQPGGSQGNLCLGGAIGRYLGANELRRAGTSGTAYLQLGLDTVPRAVGFQSAVAGETWRFQAYYRDSVGGSAVTNFSEGLGVLLR